MKNITNNAPLQGFLSFTTTKTQSLQRLTFLLLALITITLSATIMAQTPACSTQKLFAWGNNESGQLGNGSNVNANTPLQSGNDNWLKISAGGNHTIALKPDGTLWAWGRNASGALGDGTNIDKNVPIKIGTATWSHISAGNESTFAIKSDGTLWAWGYNEFGQLGIGNNVNKNTPVQVGVDRWLNISAGTFHTIGIKSNGTLWAWGYNYLGRLGTGDELNKNAPVQIDAGKWLSVSAGGAHNMGIKSDSTRWSWGVNGRGELGNGGGPNLNVPTKVGTDKWLSLSAGGGHTLGIKKDGTLWSWGADDYYQLGFDTGQLGSPNARFSATPTQLGTDKWLTASAGDLHSVGIKTNGALWAWGSNNFGELGNGGSSFVIAPVQIGTETNWVQISADGSTMALKCTTTTCLTPSVSGANTVAVGATITLTGSATTGTKTWVSSNTAVATVVNGVVKGIAVGTVTITYTITEGSCTASATKTITVTSPVPVCNKPNRPYMVDLNNSKVIFKWDKVPNAVSYDWEVRRVNNVDFKTGNTLDTITTSALPVPLPGESQFNNVEIHVRTRCASGISAWSDSLIAFKTCTDVAVITGGNTVNVGGTLTLTGTTTRSIPETWTSSNTEIATISTTGIVTGIKAGTVTITYVLHANGGFCFSIATQTITVKTPTSCSIVATISGGKVVCVGDLLTLTGSATTGTKTWTSSNTTVATVSNGIVKGIKAGTATITYSIKEGSCTSSVNKAIIVTAIPPVPILTIVQPTCSTKGSIQITNLPATYSTQLNNGVWTLGKTTYSGLPSGTYRIKIGDDGCESSKTITLITKCPPTTNLATTASVLEIDGRAELNRIHINGVVNDGQSIDFFTLEKQNNNTGNFDLLATQNNKNPIENLQNLTFYDAHPDNGENIYRIKAVYYDAKEKVSSIKTVIYTPLSKTAIFPNPADDFLDIDVAAYKDASVSIYLYNSYGTLAKMQHIEKAGTQAAHLDISPLQSGNYLVRLVSKGHKDVVQPVVIMK
jgi:alpha-tubulin suppressor-like RCC1 family protein/uncharacterized protein YjdB